LLPLQCKKTPDPKIEGFRVCLVANREKNCLPFTHNHTGDSIPYTVKSEFGDVPGQSGSALHAYFGFSIFLVAAMVFRKQFHSMMPWLIVCGVELFNEFLDMLISISTLGHISWSNS